MNEQNIPAEVLERIQNEGQNAARQFSFHDRDPKIKTQGEGAAYYAGWFDAAKAEFSRWGIHPVHPVFKGWDSAKLIGRVRMRFQELIAKKWDWRSFYNGWIEGRSEMLQQGKEEWDASDLHHASQVGPVWIKASEWNKRKVGHVIAKTNYKRNILAFVMDGGHIDWRNREYEDEKVDFVLDESRQSSIPVAEDEAYSLLKHLVDTDLALTYLYDQGIMSGSAFIQAEHDLGMAKQNAQDFLQQSKINESGT